MSFYIGREASKLWKRFCAEITTEINLLAENWKYLLGGLICQELGQDRAYVSETVFTSIFLSFVLGLGVLSCLSISSDHNILFYSAAWSKLSLPRVPRGVLYGCGDLIFSSHMIFSLVFVRTYHKYGTRSFIKQLAWLAVVIQSLLIVASRKHYTVDVVVAWYTVNLVVFFIDKKLPELPDRSNGAATLFLPLTKDNRTKEENHKLLNGNSGDSADWRPRTQVNGKIMEEGNVVHVEAVINGV
ncbi:hypothetical protein DH2020_045997 [Rehmannia glutinosa]|uniref:Sphingomyelin synthase-like domain-containing protein n=1 Tax=Rehmannia glutinosa TaxID=99300 RepID=A0ABR0UCV7_REHGL